MNDFYCFDMVVPLVDAPVNVYFTWELSDKEMMEFNKSMFSDSDHVMEDRCSYCTFISNEGGPISIDIVLDEINWVTWAHEAFHALAYIQYVSTDLPMMGKDTQEWGAKIQTFILDAIDNEFLLYKKLVS